MMSAIPRLCNEITRRAGALALAMMLASCNGGPQPAPPTGSTAAPTLQQLIEQARAAAPAERARYQLDIVELQLREKNTAAAQEWLQKIAEPALTPTQRSRYNALAARLSAQRKEPRPTATLQAPRFTASGEMLRPEQIALLLPLSGKLAGFGSAVRDGFMAAWYDAKAHGQMPPRVRFYDSAQTTNFIELYQRAQADGAQLIIGPLEKSQVAALYAQSLSVPTLALNRAEMNTPPPQNLYQFGLAPEDEAAQIARIAGAPNHCRALIVAPENEQRAHELQTFIANWQQRGCEIAATAYFRTPQTLSQSIKAALNIPQSETRRRELENLFGRKLEFAPHRRGDIDMVFMLAKPQQARSIVPTLAFHYASDVPAYALSRSYNGVNVPDIDRDDIEGLHFTEMPWVLDAQQPLKQKILATLPQSQNYLRIYALGVDSFYLYPRLRQMEAQPDLRIDGQTGYLTLSPQRIVQRELLLAQIRDGVARATTSNTTTIETGTERPDDSPINAAP